jgi:DNA-directed RNA polymerase subunit N (RpoN/RPB10)
MLPIRCFTCNKVLGHYSDYVERNKIDVNFFKKNHIERYCCKKILLTSVDIHKELYTPRDESFCKIKKNSEIKKIIIAR